MSEKLISPNPKHVFLTLDQAQDHYGFSRSFIYQLRREQGLRFHYLSKKPYLKVSEIDKLFKPESEAARKNGKEVAHG